MIDPMLTSAKALMEEMADPTLFVGGAVPAEVTAFLSRMRAAEAAPSIATVGAALTALEPALAAVNENLKTKGRVN